MEFSSTDAMSPSPQANVGGVGGMGGPIPLPRRGASGTQAPPGKRMEPWRGCPLFPAEGWEDRSSHSLGGLNRLEEVEVGAHLGIRLGVHEGTKTVWFPEWLDPWELEIEGIRTRWGTTPPGIHYKAQLFEINPATSRMASNGVLKTRALHELEAKKDDDVDIGQQDWPINDTSGVPQAILEEIENRREEREEREEDEENQSGASYDPPYGRGDLRGGLRGDPRFASPTASQGAPGMPGVPNPQGVNPFAPGGQAIPNVNPFAGAGSPHPGFQTQHVQQAPVGPQGPMGFAQPGTVGSGMGPMGGMGAMGGTAGGMGPMVPPQPGYEWAWVAYPQGGGTFVQREIPKPAPPPPPPVPTESFEEKLLKYATIGGALAKAMEPLLGVLKPTPAQPAPPPVPSQMESLATRLLERQLTAPAQAPAPAVDAKAIEERVRMEFEMRAMRDQLTRLREARSSSEPKQPASESFLKQYEQYRELAEKLNPGPARDEVRDTLSMIADIADTEGAKEMLGKIGDGIARWLNTQPSAPPQPQPIILATGSPHTPHALPQPAPAAEAPTASYVAAQMAPDATAQGAPGAPGGAQALALDPDGYAYCLQCQVPFRMGGEEAGQHAGHPFARLTAPEVLG